LRRRCCRDLITHKLPWIMLSCLLAECWLESDIPHCYNGKFCMRFVFFLEKNDASMMQLWDFFLIKPGKRYAPRKLRPNSSRSLTSELYVWMPKVHGIDCPGSSVFKCRKLLTHGMTRSGIRQLNLYSRSLLWVPVFLYDFLQSN
jgi:hypothetical protein